MDKNCKKYRCKRIYACPLAEDDTNPNSIIVRDESGTWVPPFPKVDGDDVPSCPARYADCDKELKEVPDERPKVWIKYALIAAAILVLLTLLFAMTGEPSEEARREAAAEQLKQIWPWLKTR